MTTSENLAKDLHMKPETLLRKSLEKYLRHKLKVVESELFLLAKKYGAETVADFDKLVEEGKFHSPYSYLRRTKNAFAA
ncbi:MAG: hypothetical protein C4530_22695 [Desulfobacteraceae bacterium]|nr:MAG: hypothetical protein C4530_22695 [Desulfobacteraceae bacterium]